MHTQRKCCVKSLEKAAVPKQEEGSHGKLNLFTS